LAYADAPDGCITKKKDGIVRQQAPQEEFEYGLKKSECVALRDVLAKSPGVDRVVLFGSRAMGTYSAASDIDLALYGDGLTLQDVAQLASDIEECNLPVEVDLIRYDTITSEPMKEHIAKFGKVFYGKRLSSLRNSMMASETEVSDNSNSSWPVISLRELIEKGDAELQTGPFGTMLHAKAYTRNGVPVVAVRNIGDNRLLGDDIPHVDDVTALRLERYRLIEGDIVFGRKGAVDRRALVTSDENGWLQGSDCIRLRLNQRNINPRFISFILGSPYHRAWIIQHAHGATMPSLNQEILSRLPIPIPGFNEQQNIAAVLGAFDDKIELNRRMNETLEAMARALFKDWFVDFGPTRAKAEGRAPYLAPDLWALFPDRIDDEGKPEGWISSHIGDEVAVVGGSTPSTTEPLFWADGTHCWATPKDLSSLHSPVLLATDRRVTDSGLAKISSGLLPSGTVLLSSRAPIGYLAIAEVPTAINQGFIAMVCDRKLSNIFALYWCHEHMETILSKANGSTFQEISKSNFRPIPVVVPSPAILDIFEVLVRPLYHRMVASLRE